MRDVLSWALDDLLTALPGVPLVREPRPEAFRRREAGRGAAAVRLTADGWLAARGRLNLRYCRVQTPSADVATAMIYPTASPDLVPIYCAEWVVVGDHCHALILDVELAGAQPALAADVAAVLADPARRWQGAFPREGPLSPWFAAVAQPWALFCSRPLADLPRFREACLDYRDRVAEALYRPRLGRAEPGPDHPDVAAYKAHHAAHSPGRKILTPRLGVEATEAFLRDWHFGPAGCEPGAGGAHRVEARRGRSGSDLSAGVRAGAPGAGPDPV